MIVKKVETTGDATAIALSADRVSIVSDNQDVAVCKVELKDKKGRFVPTACQDLKITVDGPIRILGVGNGDPAYQATERPVDSEARTYEVKTFNGLAQILLQSTHESGTATLSVEGDNLKRMTLSVEVLP